MNLRRDINTPVNEHINRFNQLLQEVEYNRPSIIVALQSESINLQFMTSLGDSWETFFLAKGDWIRNTSTAELHAEVRAMNSHRSKSPTTQSSSNPPSAKALSSYFDNHYNIQYDNRDDDN